MATAQDGRMYAQIINGKCHWIFTKAELPEWNGDQIQTVDVTGSVPTVGDAWDGAAFVPPPAPPVIIPPIVTMAQARLALLQAGLLAQVNAAVAAMPGIQGDAIRIEWEFRAVIRRDSPTVAALSAGLGLTETQLDELFTLAATL